MFYPSKNQKRPYNALESRFYIAQTGCQGRGREFESRFPLQTPRIHAGCFCLGAEVGDLLGCLVLKKVYKSSANSFILRF